MKIFQQCGIINDFFFSLFKRIKDIPTMLNVKKKRNYFFSLFKGKRIYSNNDKQQIIYNNNKQQTIA